MFSRIGTEALHTEAEEARTSSPRGRDLITNKTNQDGRLIVVVAISSVHADLPTDFSGGKQRRVNVGLP